MPARISTNKRYAIACCGKQHVISVTRKLKLYVNHHSPEDIKQWQKFVGLGGEFPPCLQVQNFWPEIVRNVRGFCDIPEIDPAASEAVHYCRHVMVSAWPLLSQAERLVVCLRATLKPHEIAKISGEELQARGMPPEEMACRLLRRAGLLNWE